MTRQHHSSERRPRRSRAQWRDLIAEQEASGLSVTAFSREHDLCPQTVYGWRSRLARESPAPSVAFVQLETSENVSEARDEVTSAELSVTFPSGATLRCPSEHLAELVTALTGEAGPC